MRALDRKLLRDVRRLWAQVLAIALVLACGVAIFLTSAGMYSALSDTREAYYERNRFPDVFVSLKRAPVSLLPSIAAIPGVMRLEARTTGHAILDIEGRSKTAQGRILSFPEGGPPALNIPVLIAGRFPDPALPDEVLVNAAFAEAHGFLPGDGFTANLDGRKRILTISGTALSPEFVYAIGPGAMMPDEAGFAVIWMGERAVAAAFDMTGAFNDLAIALTPGARAEPVEDAVDAILEPYGGLGAYGRDTHASDAFLDAEIGQLRGMALVLPPIFFGIAAFLVAMVTSRIVSLERSTIGLLKAAGYSDTEVCLHYLMFAALIALLGVVLGSIAGAALARATASQYAEFFNFPFVLLRVPPWVFATGGLAGLATTSLGAAQAAITAARLAPAIAMQPPAPPRFRRNPLDALMAWLKLRQTTIMILRSLVRWPLRSALTALGLGLAVASVVASSFINDALDEIIDLSFFQANRQDAILLFDEDLPESALEDIRRLPGVLQAEGQQIYAATLRHGHLSKRVSIDARRPGTDLARVIDREGLPLQVEPGGVLLSSRLAQELDVTPGGRVDAEFRSGRRETVALTVTGIVEQTFGLGAYMDLAHLNALHRQAPRLTVANVTLDGDQSPAFHAALKEMPRLAGLVEMNENRLTFKETIDRNVSVMNTIYITVAVLITAGVAYNAAAIQLSERARELASLRILGFSQREVSYILVGEIMLLALIAQPCGWLIGSWIALAMTQAFTSDLYAIPLVLKPATFAQGSLVVLSAALVCVLIVRRRLDRLDLVAVMKARE